MANSERHSLSMHLRAEAMKLPSNSSSLPRISTIASQFQCLSTSNSFAESHVEISLAKLQKKSLRLAKKMEHSSSIHSASKTYSPEKSTFSRLSGLYDDMAVEVNKYSFSDRESIQHPVALCVRCSKSASVCAECCQDQQEKALMFYRQARAIGTIRFYESAIIRSGQKNLCLFTIFRLWRNLTRKNGSLRKRRTFVAEKWFTNSLVYLPFKAWQKYTKENLINRKSKIIEQLREKVSSLETFAEKANAERATMEYQLKCANNDIAKRETRVNELETLVDTLKTEINSEQNRVKALLSLTNAIAICKDIIAQFTNKECKNSRKALLELPVHLVSDDFRQTFKKDEFLSIFSDIPKLLSSNDKSTIESSSQQKVVSNISAPASSVSITAKQSNRIDFNSLKTNAIWTHEIFLCQWAIAQSQLLTRLTIPCEGLPIPKPSVETFPSHKDLSFELFNVFSKNALKTFCDGRLLSRVIFSVIVQALHRHLLLTQDVGVKNDDNNSKKSQNLQNFTNSQKTMTYLRLKNTNLFSIEEITATKALWKACNFVEKSPANVVHTRSLLDHCFSLANKYLNVPLFVCDPIIAENDSAIVAVLMALFQASTAQIGDEVYSEISQEMSIFEENFQDLSKTFHGIESHLLPMQESAMKLASTVYVEENVQEVVIPSETQETNNQLSETKITENENNNNIINNNNENNSNENEEQEQIQQLAEPIDVIPPPDANYNELITEIDEIIANNAIFELQKELIKWKQRCSKLLEISDDINRMQKELQVSQKQFIDVQRVMTGFVITDLSKSIKLVNENNNNDNNNK